MTVVISGNNGVTGATWTTATRPSSPTQGQSGYNTTTNCVDTYNGSSWTSVPQPTSQGTSGQYLQSAGAGSAPTWATLSVSSSGQLIRAPQIKTSGTSYTTPSNCTAIYVEMVGGGGGGGSTNQGTNFGGGGGGAGAYCAKYFTVTGSTAYTYAIGAGGSGNNSGNTNNGGSTTFTVGATTITAGGGTGGGGGQGGGGGGTATNGDINVSGTPGCDGFYLSNTNSLYIRGGGGNSVFGGAPGTLWSGGGGNGGASANGYGSGGGGATGNVQTSGSGSQGVIRIWEYT